MQVSYKGGEISRTVISELNDPQALFVITFKGKSSYIVCHITKSEVKCPKIKMKHVDIKNNTPFPQLSIAGITVSAFRSKVKLIPGVDGHHTLTTPLIPGRKITIFKTPKGNWVSQTVIAMENSEHEQEPHNVRLLYVDISMKYKNPVPVVESYCIHGEFHKQRVSETVVNK